MVSSFEEDLHLWLPSWYRSWGECWESEILLPNGCAAMEEETNPLFLLVSRMSEVVASCVQVIQILKNWLENKLIGLECQLHNTSTSEKCSTFYVPISNLMDVQPDAEQSNFSNWVLKFASPYRYTDSLVADISIDLWSSETVAIRVDWRRRGRRLHEFVIKFVETETNNLCVMRSKNREK